MAFLQVASPLSPSSSFFSQIHPSKRQIFFKSHQPIVDHHQNPRFSSLWSLSKANFSYFTQHSTSTGFTVSCSAHASATVTNETTDLNSELVCIHDSARPLVLSSDAEKVLNDGLRVGAAVPGVPAKATIKEVLTPDDLLLAERILKTESFVPA